MPISQLLSAPAKIARYRRPQAARFSMFPIAAKHRAAFSIIEIILVIAIIAMMIAIIIPGVLHSRKRGRAEAVRHEMKLLDTALQQYALQTGKEAGATATFGDVKKYLDPLGELVRANGNDELGHPFGTFTIGSPITVPAATADELGSVVDPAFWADYK
jgi:type II secretory pathway pseudopilin PulG